MEDREVRLVETAREDDAQFALSGVTEKLHLERQQRQSNPGELGSKLCEACCGPS
jgi:hypothetical protein